METKPIARLVVRNVAAITGDRSVRAWEGGFWEGVRSAQAAFVVMPSNWMEQAFDAAVIDER